MEFMVIRKCEFSILILELQKQKKHFYGDEIPGWSLHVTPSRRSIAKLRNLDVRIKNP